MESREVESLSDQDLRMVCAKALRQDRTWSGGTEKASGAGRQ